MARPGALAHLRRQRRKRDSEIGGSLRVAPVMGGRTRHGRQTAALLRRARARRRRAARRDARERRCCPSSGAGADRALEHGADTRHSGTGCRPIVLSMSASVGFGIAVSSVAAARIWPDWQSPHLLDPGLRQRVAVVRMGPIDRGHLPPIHDGDCGEAGADGSSVHQDGAGAARGDSAALLRFRQVERVAQSPQQGQVRIGVARLPSPVLGQGDWRLRPGTRLPKGLSAPRPTPRSD